MDMEISSTKDMESIQQLLAQLFLIMESNVELVLN